jgi:hypothetical protein
MVSTSKILTVSYGTFSCTLEGFDDSFETMKAIAEYFRDLASEDRYFGAEPPVPDAEMLARIAEREIARRVEAREERGGIVLRAAPYGAVAAPLAPQAAPAAQSPAALAEVAPEAPHVQETAAAASEVAAAPVAENPVASPAVQEPVAMEEPVAHVAEASDSGADDWEDATLDDFSVETASVATMATPPLRHTAVPHPDPESVAAKLQRIRDVVTKSAATPAPEAYSEDEHAESFLNETAQSFEAALDLDDQASDDDMEGDDDEIAALLSRLAGEDKAERDAPPAPAEPVANDIDLREFDETDLEDVAQTEDAPAALDSVEDDPEPDTAEAEEARTVAEVEQKQAVTPSRVIKIKRSELEEAIAKGKLEQVEDDFEDTQSEEDAPVARLDLLQMVPRGDLSPEDEAELRRELAAVEAELLDLNRDTNGHAANDDDLAELDDDTDDEEVTSLFEDDEAEDDAPLVLREPRDQLVKVKAEDDMSRLLAKAENALTEPESASRRNAIAHLRAAVAATKAEQSAGTTRLRDPAYSSFREDLDNVVRPRRPVGEAAGATARPSEQRPAPLKLVAEQRVDLPQTRPSEQVRPRRVSLAPMPDDAGDNAPATTVTVSEGGFDEFARKMGATALPDLLEAAAAYLVYVEGQSEFSRPQLMTKARQAAGSSLSREDGLRSFGQLLRLGKIQKIRSGRFTASDDISFKPAARRVG